MLNPGTRLGPYEVVAPLGSGGMGEVYRARDARLGRDVAVKVLPEVFAKDADRLHRFEQEARTIAALNHPNILGIHDIGTHEGRPYLVSELLEGETLREKLAHGPIAVKRVIEYAQGIAQGLAAAHHKGIVHRDLKPENIFSTRDGRVKVLDFGLAKLVRPDEKVETAMTLTSPATVPGMVMGTMGYMSPEQVKGEASDARSDIFSFGAVLFEMLTGKRAFKRDNAAETMTAILREEPPELAETGWQGPLGLQRILSRCLEKSPERRFQSASDLGFAIEALSGTSAGTGSQAHRAVEVKRHWWPWLAGATGLLVVVAGAWFVGRSSAVKPVPRFTRLTYQRGILSNARFTKDGETILYSARWGDDPSMRVYSVRTEFPQSTKMDFPSANLLALAPGGELQVAVGPVNHANFVSGTRAQTQMTGGTPRVQQNEVISADYAPDGKAIAVSRIADQKVELEYPLGKVIYASSGYLDYLRVGPDGKSIAFLEHPVFDDDRGWVALIDGTGKHRQLTPEYSAVQGLAWSPTGKELWFASAEVTTDRSLRAVTLGGKVRVLLTTPAGMRLLDIAADGRALVAREELRAEITGIDPATGKERRGLEWFDGTGLSDITPDGKAFLGYEWGGPAGPLYIVMYRKLDGSAPTALGDGGGTRLSPDGKTAAAMVFTRPPQVALYPIGTGESKKLSVSGIVSLSNVVWYPDGKHLLIVAAKEGQALRTYEIGVDGGEPKAVGPPEFLGFAVAPDGKRVAGIDGAGNTVILNQETQKLQNVPAVQSPIVLGAGADQGTMHWTEDGQALLITEATSFEGTVYRVDVATGKKTPLQKVELSDKAGAKQRVRIEYAEKSKTYVYGTSRVLTTLYVVEGLE